MQRLTGGPEPTETPQPEQLERIPSLQRISDMVDWQRFESLVSGIESARGEKPGYPPLTLAKALLLQRLHGLSDSRLADELGDRLSFRQFIGLGLQDGIPDESTIRRFKAALEERGLGERLFLELRRQMDAHGVSLRRGRLVDAELVKAPGERRGRQAPRREG